MPITDRNRRAGQGWPPLRPVWPIATGRDAPLVSQRTTVEAPVSAAKRCCRAWAGSSRTRRLALSVRSPFLFKSPPIRNHPCFFAIHRSTLCNGDPGLAHDVVGVTNRPPVAEHWVFPPPRLSPAIPNAARPHTANRSSAMRRKTPHLSVGPENRLNDECISANRPAMRVFSPTPESFRRMPSRVVS